MHALFGIIKMVKPIVREGNLVNLIHLVDCYKLCGLFQYPDERAFV